MQPAVGVSPQDAHPDEAPIPVTKESEQFALDVAANEPRNFITLALYQVLMRTGWIFKTESIIMPAVLDSLGGAGWLRGCLPLLNRFGQSVPPLLMTRRIKVMGWKKRALATCTLMMSASFLSLSAIWFAAGTRIFAWMPYVFLAFYAMFFVSTGINQLTFSTVQGKLIQVHHRGRLLLVSSVFGAFTAILAAWLLLPLWLRPDGHDFAMIFGFTGIAFTCAALCAALLAEPADQYRQTRSGINHLLSTAWFTIRTDANFRRLAIVTALFGTCLMLFPHYQALGRGGRDTADLSMLIWWVIVQNAGTALFSILAGPLADWRGNRLVLRVLMLAISAAPILALTLTRIGSTASSWFWLVFLFVGMTPIAIKTLHNYTLEISEPQDHPRYLSTLNLCAAAPVFLSPVVGYLVDVVGFEAVFVGITLLLLTGWLITFRLREPRHHISTGIADAPVSDDA